MAQENDEEALETSKPLPEGEIPASARKVIDAATRLGIPFELRLMAASTRTAEEAAAACDTTVDRIVKSLVFKGKTTKKPVLILVSGKNRVNEKAMASLVGEVLERADAEFARKVTGYAIGGIPPLGLANRVPVLMDDSLIRFARVWCAAGTPNAVMQVPTLVLARAISARLVPMESERPPAPPPHAKPGS